MDFSEKWGKDVDEAVKLALAELKISLDEAEVTVLEESSKGFFGLGSKLAKVRVEKKQSDAKKESEQKKETEPKKPKPTKEAPKKEPAKKEPSKQKIKESAIDEDEKPSNLVETTENPALVFVKELADKMELTLEIKAMENDECVYIDIEGNDSGTFIGKRGQTLDAVQYLASLVANKDKAKYIRVVVDAEGYRTKRKKTLEQLADRLAGKVIRTRRSVRLEPMNPYERKVIHARLQGNNKVVTRSEGEEPYRRVVIETK